MRVVVQEPKKLQRLGFREKEEFEKLETELEDLQQRVDKWQNRVSKASETNEWDKVNKASEKLSEVSAKLDTKTERWLELAERHEAAGAV